MANRTLYFPKLKRRAKYSIFTSYRQYRQEIREDCQGRCVYCDVHENEIGGQEFMTLDHFRPKDKYTGLQHDPTNLLWSCTICNSSKANCWPAYGSTKTHVKRRGFVDPFSEDLHGYFDVAADGSLIALKHPSTFMINRLKLNRTGAKRVRAKRRVTYEERELRIAYLVRALTHVDNLLDRCSDLPEDFEADLQAHREELCRLLELAQADPTPDFTLR